MATFYFSEEDKDLDQILKFLEPNPNLPDDLQIISSQMAMAAQAVLQLCPRNAERTAGLRKLLEAKDCFVRAALK